MVDKNITSNGEDAVISKDRISKRYYILYVKNSTARIHIMYNSSMITMNEERRAKRLRCLPYKRELDRYTTFSVFATKDENERKFINSEEKVKNIISSIITSLRNDVPGTSLDEVNPLWLETDFGSAFIPYKEKSR